MGATLADALLAWAWYQTVFIIMIGVALFYLVWKRKQG